MFLGQKQASELLDSLQIGVVVHARDTSILYANPRALELLRINSEQAIGRSSFDPEWHFLDKFGRVMPVEDYPVNKVLASKSSLQNYQAGICDSSEEVTWVNCIAHPEFDAEGEIDRVIVNFRDITAEKEAIPFEEIVSLSNDSMLVTEVSHGNEQKHEIVYVNKAFTELTGYSVEEVIGRTPQILQGELTDPEGLSRLQAGLKGQRPLRETMLNYRKDGSTFWNEMSIYPLKNPYNELVYYVGIQRDVTERVERENIVKRSNQELKERNLELEAIGELRSEIMGVAAHDLRNPLYSLTGSLEIIRELIEKEDPEVFDIIRVSVKNMNLIIDDLLLSRSLEKAEISMSLKRHSITGVIDEVCKLNMNLAAQKQIGLKKDKTEKSSILFDYDKLLRALDNLLSNAIKFSPKGKEVVIGSKLLDGDTIRIYVKDEGPGLTEGDISKVFNPFQRLSAQPTNGELSTGLGLSIVKKIAELHGGRVGVDSKHGEGATFYIDLKSGESPTESIFRSYP